MMLFETRKANLREDALTYIRTHLKKGEKFELGGIFEYFENNGEAQVCEVTGVTIEEIEHKGTLSDQIDTDDLHAAPTDLLCTIADRIHLEPLKYME